MVGVSIQGSVSDSPNRPGPGFKQVTWRLKVADFAERTALIRTGTYRFANTRANALVTTTASNTAAVTDNSAPHC